MKHDGASWGIMRGPFRRQPVNKHRHLMGKHTHARIFTRLHVYPRLCMIRICMHMHAQAHSGGSPQTNIAMTILMGKRLQHCRAGIYPPAFFSLGPVHPFLLGDGGAARSGNNNTMALPMGPVPSIAAREFPLNRSGSPPSL